MSALRGSLSRRHLVHSMLRAGFGVEDIEIKIRKLGLHISQSSIRGEIKHLRENGDLMGVLALKWRSHGKAIREDECSGDHQQEEPPEEGDQL